MIDHMLEDIQTIGLANERIIIKTDQENAITDVQKALSKSRQAYGTALGNSKVGDSDSNGKVEKCVQDFKGLVRTFRSDLESKLGTKIKLSDPVVPWLVRHAGHIMTRCRVREGGGRHISL